MARVCSSAGRAAVSKAAGRGFESLRTRPEWSKVEVNVAADVKAMESKKQENQTHVSKQAAALEKFKIRDWVESLKGEISSIHWTSKEELRVYTKIVVGATFFFGMGVYLVDLAIHGVMNFFSWTASLLVG